MNWQRPSAFSLIGIAILASVPAVAQSADINSSATIITPITARATASLDFGTIVKGVEATILPSSRSAASVTFSGDESDNVTIAIPLMVTLITTSGDGASMTVLLYAEGSGVVASDKEGTDRQLEELRNAEKELSERETLTGDEKPGDKGIVAGDEKSGGIATMQLSSDKEGDGVNGDGLGQAYLRIGGTVTPTAMQQRGSYSGTFTVSASYSN